MTDVDRSSKLNSQADDRPRVVAFSLEDLRSCSLAEIRRDNEDLATLSRQLYEWCGTQYEVGRAVEAVDEALWLQLNVTGQVVVIGLSRSLASALLQVDNLNWDELSPGILSLWAHQRLGPRWPAHLPLVDVALHRDGLGVDPSVWALQSHWSASLANASEPTSLAVSIWSEHTCPLDWISQALAPWFVGYRPYPLRHLSLRWPLVAARWTVDAHVLSDLAIGDVLLLN
jgi:hypothetical protein